MKSIFIIRHGQSIANTGAESMPDKSIPLSDLGIKQAQCLLESWLTLTEKGQLPKPKNIYCSEMLRAKQTASVFCDQYQIKATCIGKLNEFACLSYETVQGMLGKQRSPLARQYWQTADLQYREGSSADTFSEFIDRVDSFIQIAPELENNSLCFGHGIWLGLLAYRLMGCTIKTNADIQKFRQFQTAMPMYNTVAYRLDISHDGVMQLQIVNALKS